MATAKQSNLDFIPEGNHGTNHMHQLGSRFVGFRNDDSFCDVTIKIQDHVFNAHKVILAAGSDFFNTMFTSRFQEHQLNEIVLEYGDGETFELLLDFIYSGNFKASHQHIVTQFEMANYYQIQHAISVCADYFVQHLHSILSREDGDLMSEMMEEVERIITVASDANQGKLMCVIHEYVKDQLHQLVSDGISSDTPIGVLSVILDQGEELAVLYSEEEILRMVVAWLNHDWACRRIHASGLIKKIRLGVISTSTLHSTFRGDLLEISECRNLFDKVIELTKQDKGPLYRRPRVSLRHSQHQLFAPRSTTTTLVSVGGSYEDESIPFMQCFDDKNDRWVPLGKLPQLPFLRPEEALFHPGVIVVEGNLYIAGGKVVSKRDSQFDDGIFTNIFYRYCADTNIWIELPSMHNDRHMTSLVHLGDYIYVIGGHKSHLQFVNGVNAERFDVKKGFWEQLPLELDWGTWPPVAVSYRGKILIYGPDEYDDSPGEQSTYILKAFYPDRKTWKTVWTDHRISGYRQSIITVVDDSCYEIKFTFNNRNVPTVRELILDLESDPPTFGYGDCEDQSTIECNEVFIKGDLYVIVTFPGYVHKKNAGSSWFHSSNIDGTSCSVVCYTFDKLGLM